MDNKTFLTEQETNILNLLQTTELSHSEIGKQLTVSRQKVTRVAQKYIQSGLGDAVEKFTKASGIKKIVEIFTPAGADCGCEERKERLNQLFKHRVQNCLTKEQFDFLDRFFSTWNGLRTPPYSTLNELALIRNKVFSLKYTQPNPTCLSCVRGIVNPLRKVYEEYMQELTKNAADLVQSTTENQQDNVG